MSLLGRFFGVLRDDPDSRDHRFLLSHPEAAEVALPMAVDLHKRLPPARHQESIGSCTAQASAGLMAYLYPGFDPSPLALYYDTRVREGTADRDAGSQIRNAMKVLQKTGAIGEDDWPYDTSRFAEPPPADASPRYSIAAYSRLASENEMLSCLALRQPFVLAIMLPDYFTTDVARHGVMSLPSGKADTLGSHAMLCVGYDLEFHSNPDFIASGLEPSSVESTALLVRNSWGPFFGRDGHAWLPMSWATNPSTGGDAWTGHKLFTTANEPQGPTVAGVRIEGRFQPR